MVFKGENPNFLLFNYCLTFAMVEIFLIKINVNTDKKAIITSFNRTELVSDESQTFIQFT